MKNNSEISERITEIIEYLSIKPNAFAQKLGYDRSQTIYDIINKKSAPSYDFFNRFMNSEYSEIISIKWLLTGSGIKEVESSQKIAEEPFCKYIPSPPPCRECALKDQMIEILNREIATQAEFIKFMQGSASPPKLEVSKAAESPVKYGQKRKA